MKFEPRYAVWTAPSCGRLAARSLRNPIISTSMKPILASRCDSVLSTDAIRASRAFEVCSTEAKRSLRSFILSSNCWMYDQTPESP